MRRVTSERKIKMNTKNLLRISVLGAIGFILMQFEFSVLPSASFLKLNLCDIPALFASFAIGPVAGFLVVLIENALHLFQSFSGGVGELANVIISGTFALVAGLVYKKLHTKKGAFLALVIGSIAMICAALLANRFINLPLYGIPAPQIMPTLLAAILPFNAIKAVIITVLTMLLYKPLSPLLKEKN